MTDSTHKSPLQFPLPKELYDRAKKELQQEEIATHNQPQPYKKSKMQVFISTLIHKHTYKDFWRKCG